MSANEHRQRRLLRYTTEVLHLERDSIDRLPEARLPADLREFADVWLKLRGDRAAPLKRDIGPFSIPARLLPNIMLWEILEDDYLCRLAGTGLRVRSEKELSGCLLSDLYGDTDHDAWDEFDGVAQGGVYSLVERAVIWDELPTSIRTRLLLPLLSDDGDARYMVALIGPSFRYEWEPGFGAVRAENAPPD
jgi:hypothetical protein